MSAPVAGKFQDHYEVLGVETNAELSTIELAYFDLIDKYQASNLETGDPEKLEAAHLAFEVLSKPDLRSSFDKMKGVGEDNNSPRFTGPQFFDTIGREAGLRAAILAILYDRRRGRPFTPSLSMRHLENILAAESDQVVFVLWYLKQRGMVASDDKSSLQITVEGMEHLENTRPTAELVMPWIKPAYIVGADSSASAAPAASEAPASAPIAVVPQAVQVHAALIEAPENESRRRAVDRILSRATN